MFETRIQRFVWPYDQSVSREKQNQVNKYTKRGRAENADVFQLKVSNKGVAKLAKESAIMVTGKKGTTFMASVVSCEDDGNGQWDLVVRRNKKS